jgi:lipoyl(octanoyl) transferase
MTPLFWSWLGRQPYRPVWDLMEETRRRVQVEGAAAERLLLLEHEPVITIGRSGDERNVLLREGVPVVRTSRGGDVTYHGPGQLVIYPVVRLARGVVHHLTTMAGALVDELHALGIQGAAWRRNPAGVWVGEDKIAACGVHVSRGIAIHGFALNVTAEALEGFARIVPCGLRTARTTCVAHHAEPPPLASIARRLAARLARSFARSLCACDPTPAR